MNTHNKLSSAFELNWFELSCECQWRSRRGKQRSRGGVPSFSMYSRRTERMLRMVRRRFGLLSSLDSRPSPNSLDRNLLFILIIRFNNYYNLIVTHHYLPLLFMSKLNPFWIHMNENQPQIYFSTQKCFIILNSWHPK